MAMNLLFGQNNMPHCIIEYSAPLAAQIDIDELVQSVHQGALASELFEPSAVKSRRRWRRQCPREKLKSRLEDDFPGRCGP